MTITPATIADIPALVLLVNSAYRGESSRKGWTTEAHLITGARTNETSMSKMFRRPGSVLLKACDETGNIIACVHLEQQVNHLYLGMLTVSPDVQAKGIGKQLLNASEEYAKQKNLDAIEMTVISVRSELIDWYIRHGYHKTGEMKPFHAGPEFGKPLQPIELFVLKKKLL